MCIFAHRSVFAKFTFDLNGRAEVYKQAIINAGGCEVMQELYLVFWSESANCFDLDY
jgi:hypothetical protein